MNEQLTKTKLSPCNNMFSHQSGVRMKHLSFFIAFFSLLLSSCAEQQIANNPPATYELKQNYPNPFTDSTRIVYGVPDVRPSAAPWIRLVVFDRFNQQQAILVDNAAHPAETDTITWSGNGANGFPVPTGVYYIEMEQINISGPSLEQEVTILLRITALKQ